MRRILANPYAPAFALAVVVVMVPLLVPSPFYLRLATLVFINALVVVGLNLLMGYAGQISLGHAAFFAMGAYASAIGPAHLGLPTLASMLAGIVLTGVVAYGVGKPILRFKGYHLAVATLGLGVIVSIVITNEIAWTGGPDGMQVARLWIGSWRVSGVANWYWVAGITLIVAMLGAANLLSSPTGRALRAIHDSEVAAGVLGIDVARYKLLVFVISAIYAATAGAFLALFDGHVTPVTGGILRSIEFVAMAVLGGLGSILGSVLGAAVLVVLPQALTSFHEFEHAILGAILMVLMIALRRGVIPSLQSWLLRGAA
ncbi:branched-chain amino acid ABC transporter permease [Chelatococcus reniformis]|uniref:ABC transporter permease n=1 Tax=Chelatococcus reniformis TaxID=1494448 RepID=A0A916XMI0_9HYPH|nr:branched-chain amino acid ABC transporter permease [Chelatococcus reniformis]GGC86974.1 ABC transporter permease [Chelatococcus reniformis]